MENLAPPLILALEIRRSIENGEHVRLGIKRFLAQEAHSDFGKQVLKWLILVERGESSHKVLDSIQSQHRRALLLLLEKSFNGVSISAALQDLEEEVSVAAASEMEGFLQKLPFVTLIPLLLFQFPAFMLLLVGPVLLEALHQLGEMSR